MWTAAHSQATVLVLYLIFGVGYHAMNNGKSYRQHHWALPSHVVSDVLELALYWLCRSMTPAGFALCLVQSVTNIALTKRLQKGIPSLTSGSGAIADVHPADVSRSLLSSWRNTPCVPLLLQRADV